MRVRRSKDRELTVATSPLTQTRVILSEAKDLCIRWQYQG